MKNCPAVFRYEIRREPDGDERFGPRIEPWQERDFAALDPAWRALAPRPSFRRRRPAKIRRAWIERPRGHSKTFDMAVQIAWVLLMGRKNLCGLVAAADRDQANLVWEAVRGLQQANPGVCRQLEFQKHVIRNGKRRTRLEIVSADVASSWGLLPDFVICDELSHWDRPDLFYSLSSSAAKKPDCVLAVLTNAGIGRGWQWDVREHARTHPAEWHFSSLQGCVAPWIAPESLVEQRRTLPPTVFARLWLNEWQHSDGEFVTLAEAEACRDVRLCEQTRGRAGTRYVAAIDYAEKRDFTAAIVAHREPEGRVVVDRLDVRVPAPGEPVPVAWVEEWIARTARDFPGTRFVVDPHQLVGVIQRLDGVHDIHRFEFQGSKGNHALATTLRRLIVERQVAWFPGCGTVHSDRGRDDLDTELASLLLKHSANGHCRIDHRIHLHDDRAFVLGAACLHLLREPAAPDWLHVAPPSRFGGFSIFGAG
ncbi:MAG: terminase large subunit [Planctomycetaceae bacterium]